MNPLSTTAMTGETHRDFAAQRRRFLVDIAFGTLVAVLTSSSHASLRAPFNARSLDSVLRSLELPPAKPSDEIVIEAPDVAENGANVPIEITANLPGLTRLLVIGERNLFPLLADASFTGRSKPWLELKVKLAETANVKVLALADGVLYSAQRQVKVIVGGCLPG